MGAVALSAVAAARVSGPWSIMASDVNPERREHASAFGATDLIDAAAGDPVEAVHELHSLGSTPASRRAALQRLSTMGNSTPQVFSPYLIEMWRRCELPLDQIVRHYPLSEINTAFADAERGTVVEPIITFGE